MSTIRKQMHGARYGEVLLVTGRLNRSELVEWQSDEWTIQGHLVYPHGYEEGKRYPLLIGVE